MNKPLDEILTCVALRMMWEQDRKKFHQCLLAMDREEETEISILLHEPIQEAADPIIAKCSPSAAKFINLFYPPQP
jgi:hypothetical protein